MDFRGASADALAELEGTLPSGGSSGAGGASTGEELFGVARILLAEPGLRRVLTDVSIASDAKAGLVHSVLGDRVSGPVADLTAEAVRKRWTRGRDLPDALEHLGVVAVVRSAEETERLADELFEVGELVRHNPGLRDALSDPARSTSDKRDLVDGLLEGKALPATVSLVRQAISGSHRTVGVALAAYEKVAAQVHEQSVATVRVATPLSDEEHDRLAAALQRQYDRPVHLNVVVDPEVLGGVRVEIGDDVIDGTVRSRLDDARRRLAG